ncbi:hypothetical protein MPER_12564 [Moniliophthora perniciosa FA553]|nr:hypothetical protein MPER_12564 [Moniliophthora perniciosa FA553]
MTGYDDVVDCVIGFFWRKHLNHREWDMKVSPHRERFQRSMHPFLQFISSPGPLGGSTIGNHLFNCVETLSIAAVPFPYFLFPKEIDVLAKAFPNLVSLHLVKTWCFHQLSHAVNFLASFVLLENLVVGPLMLSDDDEDAAWASLEEVACSTLPHLRAVQFNDTLSPYNLIVLLRLTPLHALERATMAIKGCTVRAWNKSGEGWRRLAMFLRTLNNLHLDVTGEPRGTSLVHLRIQALTAISDVLSIVDLRGCERLTSLKLFTGSGIDLKWMLSKHIPSTKLERLMIGSDLYPKGLAEIDEVVSRYPCLKELYYAHRLPSDSDIEGLADSELNTLRSYFPLCIARGVNVESGSYKIQ